MFEYLQMNNNTSENIKVFLSLSSDDTESLRLELKNILQKAGMDVFTFNENQSNDTDLYTKARKYIESADCSVHILGSNYGTVIPDNKNISISHFLFTEAQKKLTSDNSSFKMFIWHPTEIVGKPREPLQEEFINKIRNSITRNMVYENISSPIQLVDDIRSLMVKEKTSDLLINAADVFLIFNQLDQKEAIEIVDMLSDIISVEKLNIIQNSDVDYSEFCAQQIGKSKLAVVYFKETANWALSFVQQVWKKVGGASSHTPILLIGDDDPDTNLNVKFKAPKVISLIISGELIPLEIKVQYDKIIEATII